jgi:hypothetical protein
MVFGGRLGDLFGMRRVTRRSRWIFATSGRSPAITRRPPPRPGESAAG